MSHGTAGARSRLPHVQTIAAHPRVPVPHWNILGSVNRNVLLLSLLAGGIAPLRAQDALVLSAGGSRGVAHVGVLLALDSLRRDPDIVVGASMGVVVGALYAAGYSSDAIRRLVE